MRTYSAEALVLRTYRYGEADRIVVFLTEDRGKRRGVARHGTVSRRRFGAALEPFTRGRVTYVEREARDLVRLDRIDLRQSPLGVAAGAEGDPALRLSHAGYFAELLDEWAPEAAPNERLYRLGAAVGDALARGGSVDAIARYFEYWLLRLEGVYPA
jgi:DNA repair protein RecO (recombination protein O)